MWNRHDMNCGCGPRRGRWGGFDGFSEFWTGGGSRGRPFGRGRGSRLFEQGDLKYVILRLLEEKPRHGYDIIRELEGRLGGAYAPSPGTVYPTLTMLEDLGYARVVPEPGGKKIYEITDEGRAHLAEHSDTVDSIFERIAQFVEGFVASPMMEVNQAFKRVARATYQTAAPRVKDTQLLARVQAILAKAADEIEAIAKEAGERPSKP